jgi:AcrR family transcriptional regulator
MAPKTQFSREQIVDAAFRIACRDGMDGITARKIATEIGGSVAPVYVNFGDLDAVRDAVLDKIVQVSHKILEETDSGRPFRDIGLASIRFALRYPVLSRDLTLRPNRYLEKYRSRMDESLAGRMDNDPALAQLSNGERRDLLFRMQVFQTGLTVMTSTGQLPHKITETELVAMMEGAANDFIAAASRRTEEESK